MEDLKTIALVIAAVAGFVFLVLVAFVVYVIVRYRPSIPGIIGLLAGTAWVASPVDPLPEALLGPIGLTDDLAVIAALVWYASQLARRRGFSRRESGQGGSLPPQSSLPPPDGGRGEIRDA